MPEKCIRIETRKSEDGNIGSRIYTTDGFGGRKTAELNQNCLISEYKNFYNEITKAHAKIIKKSNLEKVVTTF